MSKIKTLTNEDFEKLNDGTIFWKNGFRVVINCQYIHTWEQFSETLGNAFQFPKRNEELDGVWDWMTDLSWLGIQEKIFIYLINEKSLFKGNEKLKKNILEWFEDLIEFWEEDVKNAFIAGQQGTPKDFEVYLVD